MITLSCSWFKENFLFVFQFRFSFSHLPVFRPSVERIESTLRSPHSVSSLHTWQYLILPDRDWASSIEISGSWFLLRWSDGWCIVEWLLSSEVIGLFFFDIYLRVLEQINELDSVERCHVKRECVLHVAKL